MQCHCVAFQIATSYRETTNASKLPLHLDFGPADLSNESKNGTLAVLICGRIWLDGLCSCNIIALLFKLQPALSWTDSVSKLPLHLDFGRADLSNESKNGTLALFCGRIWLDGRCSCNIIALLFKLQPALVGQILFPNCHSIWILVEQIFQTSRKTVRSRYFAVGFGSTAAAHAMSLRCFSNCNQLQRDN
jgi:hypothetical protein